MSTQIGIRLDIFRINFMFLKVDQVAINSPPICVYKDKIGGSMDSEKPDHGDHQTVTAAACLQWNA